LATYTLKLSFDIRQVTQSLTYEFLLGENINGSDSNNYPMEAGGPLAGTFNFQQNDEIFVEIIATAPEGESMQDFAVKNCTFVSIPARMTEYLSLFDQTSACATVDGWQSAKPIPPTPEDKAKNSQRFSIMSAKALSVVTQNGQWQISGYLSVQLPPAKGIPSFNGARHQLYFFDPEGSAGSGGGWNN